jgi:ABC-type phosphate/phosphonate transport system permease subunit
MPKNYKKLFNNLKQIEPPPPLFNQIILAIKREQEFQKTKRLLFGFLFLFFISLMATPFSYRMLVSQAKNSGTFYFISTAVSDFEIFLAFWQDFSLAILEVLPVTEIIFFSICLGISIFTLRLFLKNKNLIFKGWINNLGAI